jgi:hypothetical protein
LVVGLLEEEVHTPPAVGDPKADENTVQTQAEWPCKE